MKSILLIFERAPFFFNKLFMVTYPLLRTPFVRNLVFLHCRGRREAGTRKWLEEEKVLRNKTANPGSVLSNVHKPLLLIFAYTAEVSALLYVYGAMVAKVRVTSLSSRENARANRGQPNRSYFTKKRAWGLRQRCFCVRNVIDRP